MNSDFVNHDVNTFGWVMIFMILTRLTKTDTRSVLTRLGRRKKDIFRLWIANPRVGEVTCG